MTLQEAVKLLENHNKWRRGDDTLEMVEPKDLGIAIDLIVEHFNFEEKMTQNQILAEIQDLQNTFVELNAMERYYAMQMLKDRILNFNTKENG